MRLIKTFAVSRHRWLLPRGPLLMAVVAITGFAGFGAYQVFFAHAAIGGDVSQSGNLLSGKVFSSSVPDGGSNWGYISLATDGDGNTRSISQPTSPITLTADLGVNYTLNKVSVKWAGDTIKNFQFQMSSGANGPWTTFYSGVTANVTPEFEDYTSFSASPVGRYFRIVGTDRWNNTFGNSIWEAGVYGVVVPPPDTTQPNVSMSSPAAGATVKGSVPITGSASDNVGVSRVEFLVDGSVKATNSSSNASFSWNSTAVGDGSHSLALKAYDAANNSRQTAAVSVTVHNAVASGGGTTGGGSTSGGSSSGGSSTGSTSGSSGAKSAPAKPSFSASATTVSVGGSVTLSWSSSGATSCTLNPGNLVAGATASKVVDSVGATTTYTLSCSNSAGSASAEPVTVNVVNGAAPVSDPQITSFSAEPSSMTHGQAATLSWVASGVSAGGCSLTPSPLTSTGSVGTWQTPVLNASATYTIACVNAQGKKATKSVGVTVDGVPPPPAPDGTTPGSGDGMASAILTSSDGKTITNASVTDTIRGLTTFDPANITNTAREALIQKVEYYNGDSLVQTVTDKPFAFDSTLLADGQYTITEKTYFTDGSKSEVTKVVVIANKVAAAKGKAGNWLGILLVLLLLGGAGVGVFVLLRRRMQNSVVLEQQDMPVLGPNGVAMPQAQNYSGGTGWQQGIASPTTASGVATGTIPGGSTKQGSESTYPLWGDTMPTAATSTPVAAPEAPAPARTVKAAEPMPDDYGRVPDWQQGIAPAPQAAEEPDMFDTYQTPPEQNAAAAASIDQNPVLVEENTQKKPKKHMAAPSEELTDAEPVHGKAKSSPTDEPEDQSVIVISHDK